MEFITNNWKEILMAIIAIAEIIARLTPTEKDNSIINFIKKIVDALVLNSKKDSGLHK